MTWEHFRTTFSRNRRLITGAGTALIFLLAVNLWLSAKTAQINRLLKQHECKSTICEADFNGDGEKDLILVDETTPPLPYYTSWLTVRIGGKEELRLPLRVIDGSLRTHVATLTDNGRARLLVADGMKTRGENKSLSTVFAWNGKTLAPQPPSTDDKELLSAMMAFDEAGYGTYWSIFILLKWPTYLFCLLLLFFIFKGVIRPVVLT